MSEDAKMLMQEMRTAADGGVGGDGIVAAAISVLQQLCAVPVKTQVSTCVLMAASNSLAPPGALL